MAPNHEYAILGGFNRAKVGHLIGAVAATASSALVAIVFVLAGLSERIGLSGRISPVVLVWISAGSIYAVLYWIFDEHLWRWRRVAKALRVPDLSGDWLCTGQTINPDKTVGHQWSGRLTIVQSWDRLCVRLKTAQSESKSITASLLKDDSSGFRLMYSYRNDPGIEQADLASHLGHSEILFSNDLHSGAGEYFNGHGRYTFGTLSLVRKVAA